METGWIGSDISDIQIQTRLDLKNKTRPNGFCMGFGFYPNPNFCKLFFNSSWRCHSFQSSSLTPARLRQSTTHKQFCNLTPNLLHPFIFVYRLHHHHVPLSHSLANSGPSTPKYIHPVFYLLPRSTFVDLSPSTTTISQPEADSGLGDKAADADNGVVGGDLN